MKKVLALMLALVMVLSLAACGGNNAKESSTDKTSSQAETTEGTTEEETETPTEVKESTVELTLDNWKDYLEPVIKYSLDKDDWGKVTGIKYELELLPKEGSGVYYAEDARIAVRVTPDELSTINMNKDSDEYTLDKLSEEPTVQPYETESDITILPKAGDGFTQYITCDCRLVNESVNEIQDAGQVVTAKVISHYNVEATRIIGTLNIRSGNYVYE